MEKTFTCMKCKKIGNDFVSMAKEPCPQNDGIGSHVIPIFGDRS